ncbi:hypothetical protein N7463_001311 [Penicillium fimorum]|uniref:Major facilitator superfamily (MFS) profile domain-containing protein n=1 Tax=Penicillium fimorum TaxID=1882269 RepID=A0A9X0CCX9_9EURO|nr:hypothetical protein N7463_001311 [Penicillium fimorum]
MSSIEEPSPTKGEIQYLEQFEGTLKTAQAVTQLSEQHREYLLQRHGTLELDPIPTIDPADPYNWSTRKKVMNLILVSFHGFMGAFTATSIVCAYQDIAEDFGVSLQRINGVQLILYIFFGPETRYIGIDDSSNLSTFRREYLSFRRIDPKPFTAMEFLHPLTLFAQIPVLIAGMAYSMVFLFILVMNSVEVPQLLQSKFELDSQQLGLQFLSLVIGLVLGEQLGGIMSDLWMNTRARRIKGKPEPEYRLWLSYIGFLLTIAGMVIFLVCTDQAPAGKWTVRPLIGVAVAAFGGQVVTTVMITYAVDIFPQDAGSVGVFINFLRAELGFIGPFWFPPMFANVGVANSAAVVTGLIVAISIIPTAVLHWQGKKKHVLRHSGER